MAHLFIDSTYDLTLGLLNEDFSWAKFTHFPNQKASEIIQLEVLKMCQELGIEVSELTSAIHISGPGFYTGLRLSEGFVDVLKFSGIKSFSCYSYDLLPMMGLHRGFWVTKAYRGEYFIHQLDNKENHLISSKEVQSFLAGKSPIYFHSDKAIDQLVQEVVSSPVASLDLLEKNPQVLKLVQEQQSQRESYYFRAPEDEFRTSV